MLAGECGLAYSSTSVSPDGPSSDCPPQFNNCIGNRCIAQKVTGSCADALNGEDCVSGACTNGYCAQPASNPPAQIWFATDAIRPGVTSQSTQTNNQDYIYNIMAKGYASLDDWCMSQAQQSTIPAMRNIGSWTALIIAQPDNNSNLGATGQNRLQYLTPSINSSNESILPYVNPNSLGFSSNYNVYDKNGQSTLTQFWTAMASAEALSGNSPPAWMRPNNEWAGTNFQTPQAGPFCSASNNAWASLESQNLNGCAAVFIPTTIWELSTANVMGFFENGDSSSGYSPCGGCYPSKTTSCPTCYDYQISLAQSNSVLCLANQS